ncbi:MAG TPA: hypothetical protein PKA60_02660 [Candidatus Paceibacterota bacterium]|nr:hypothetical protein [Candidatus Paceibacterota bacterium]
MFGKSNIIQNKKNNTGLTVLEFIIYFAITLIMLSILVQISINVFSGRERVKIQQEINRSGRDALNEMTDAILNADSFEGAFDE